MDVASTGEVDVSSLRDVLVKGYARFLSGVVRAQRLVFVFTRIRGLRRSRSSCGGVVGCRVGCSVDVSRRRVSVAVWSGCGRDELLGCVDDLVLLCFTGPRRSSLLGVLLGGAAGSAATAVVHGLVPHGVFGALVVVGAGIGSLLESVVSSRLRLRVYRRAAAAHQLLVAYDGAYRELFNAVKSVFTALLKAGDKVAGPPAVVLGEELLAGCRRALAYAGYSPGGC